MFENENFLIIDSELINKEQELELEKTGFKFFQEKEQKLYFYTPYNRFNLFDIIIEKSFLFEVKTENYRNSRAKIKTTRWNSKKL